MQLLCDAKVCICPCKSGRDSVSILLHLVLCCCLDASSHPNSQYTCSYWEHICLMMSDRHDIAYTFLCTPSPTCPLCQFWMSIISWHHQPPRTPTSVTADTEVSAHYPTAPLTPFPSLAVPLLSVSSHICQGPRSSAMWFYTQQCWSVQQSSSLAFQDLLIPPESWNHSHSFALLLSFSCIRNQIISLSFKPLSITVSKLPWKKSLLTLKKINILFELPFHA